MIISDSPIITFVYTNCANNCLPVTSITYKEIGKLKKKLEKAKDTAQKLLDLVLDKVIPKSRTYSEKMDTLESERTVLEDKIEKTKARRKAADMSAHSNEYLHSNLQIAMQYLNDAPQDTQIALLQALIKIIKVL